MSKKKLYYVLTQHGPLAGIKVWPKRRKSGGFDIEFKYGCLDQERLESRPISFDGKRAANAFAVAYQCFGRPCAVATEDEVREWMQAKQTKEAEHAYSN